MGDTPSGSSAENKKRRFAMDERYEEQRDLPFKHMKKKSNMEKKRLKLDEERFESNKWKREDEVLFVKQALEHDMKVLPLREKRCSEMRVHFYFPGIVGVSLLTMTWRAEWLSTGLSTE